MYLSAPGELEGDKRRRPNDPVWSVTAQNLIERAVVKSGETVLYYLMSKRAGERGFVCEELQLVPVGTEALS